MRTGLSSLVVLVALPACGEADRNHSPTPGITPASAANATEVRTDDGTTFLGHASRFDFRKGGTPEGELSFKADAIGSNELWTALVGVDYDTVAAGHVIATVKQAPLAVGIAYAERPSAGAPEMAASGTVELSLASGSVEGRFETPSTRVSAQVKGRLVGYCWTTPDELGVPPNGQGSNGSYAVVPDEKFEWFSASASRRSFLHPEWKLCT